MVVLGGAGLGQHRRVVGFDNSSGKGLVSVDRPFDGLVNARSVLAVVPTIGAKIGYAGTVILSKPPLLSY